MYVPNSGCDILIIKKFCKLSEIYLTGCPIFYLAAPLGPDRQ